MNLAYFNRANKAYANNNNSTYESMEDEFQGECEELAVELMIRRPKPVQYDLFDFIDSYLGKIKKGNITPKRALEKYVLDVAYGKGKMDNKFRTKYAASDEAKLARLEKIRAYMNNPKNWSGNYFNYSNINDPNYYDLVAASNYTNINWYHESINGRIANYRRKVNAANRST